ncbi:hypothetical protein [Agarilytica rhodophyticola]|uniref:hypothetical protein n=1 Tax=Agarilytica rhodophyticola TaxID=1737490 RepID=UPI000B34653F|nr:hypothetical protein [Agarilytica rhodophyticola]
MKILNSKLFLLLSCIIALVFISVQISSLNDHLWNSASKEGYTSNTDILETENNKKVSTAILSNTNMTTQEQAQVINFSSPLH